jgi:hypothetical protein
VSPQQRAEADIRAAYGAYDAAFFACSQDPPNCDRAKLSEHVTGDQLAFTMNNIDVKVREGTRTRSPGPDQDYYVIESITVDPSLASAQVQVCVADGRIIYKPAAGPNGADVILNDAFSSGRETETWERGTDGVWRESGFTAIEKAPGRNICPPRGS